MKNLKDIRERYLKEPFNRRLGHLASDLARISSFSENSMNKAAIEDMLEESKFFIEWTAPDASLQVQAFFSEIQPKLALWQYRLQQQRKSSLKMEELKTTSKSWSRQLLEISGLLAV